MSDLLPKLVGVFSGFGLVPASSSSFCFSHGHGFVSHKFLFLDRLNRFTGVSGVTSTLEGGAPKVNKRDSVSFL